MAGRRWRMVSLVGDHSQAGLHLDRIRTKGVLNFISTLTQDLHPLVVHFPIVLFTLSFIFALLARFWSKLRETEWLLLVIGTLAAPVAVITGLVAHLPFEDTLLSAVIEPHQFSALIGTVVMIAVTVWGVTSRKKGKDLGQSPVYLFFCPAPSGLDCDCWRNGRSTDV